jgi:hypothetical protein
MAYIGEMIGQYDKSNLPILSLVYEDPFGRTIVDSIKKRLEKAKGVWHFSKLQTDGTKEACSILSLRGLAPGKTRIEVCGFYTDLCVLETVIGLNRAGHKIVVHNAGTGASSMSAQNSSIKRMKKLGIEIAHENNHIDRERLD